MEKRTKGGSVKTRAGSGQSDADICRRSADEPGTETALTRAQWILTTRWSIIQAAGRGDSPEAETALEELLPHLLVSPLRVCPPARVRAARCARRILHPASAEKLSRVRCPWNDADHPTGIGRSSSSAGNERVFENGCKSTSELLL